MAADAGEVILLGLLDMSAAFIRYGRPQYSRQPARDLVWILRIHLSWLESYLSRRTQQVVFNNTVSDVAEVHMGVPQGSV